MLEVSGLTRQYPEFTLQADFSVATGEFFSLLGPSGCGKTTLLRLIAGLETPDRGMIRLQGMDVTHQPPAQRRIGLVFQDYALFPHLDVEANVGYGLLMQKKELRERKARIQEMLDLFEIGSLAHRDVASLSGGERQRVALARALAPEPWAILMDEPFSALDYGLRRRLRQELRNLQKKAGFTAIFVTHHQEDAMALSDRLGIMDRGRIIQTGAPKDLYEQPKNLNVAMLLGEVNCLSGKVTRITEKSILVTVNAEVDWEIPNNGQNLALEDLVWVVIRPEDWRITNEMGLAVTVLESEYLGASTYQRIMGRGWMGRMVRTKDDQLGTSGETLFVQADNRRVVLMKKDK